MNMVFELIHKNDFPGLERFCQENHPDLNQSEDNKLGYTPLIIAVRENQAEMVAWLLDQKVDLEATDTRKGTALLHAVIACQPEMVELLLKRGAKIDPKDVDDQTPLAYICKWAKSWCFSVTLSDMGNQNNNYAQARYEKFIKLAQFLIDHGAKVDQLTAYGYSLLHLCGESDAAELVPILVKAGADPNLENSKGYRPLHAAVENKALATATKLIEAGAEVNAQDHDGFTALTSAVMMKSPELVKLLLEHGADKSLKVVNGYGEVEAGDTPLKLAERLKLEDVSKLLS